MTEKLSCDICLYRYVNSCNFSGPVDLPPTKLCRYFAYSWNYVGTLEYELSKRAKRIEKANKKIRQLRREVKKKAGE